MFKFMSTFEERTKDYTITCRFKNGSVIVGSIDEKENSNLIVKLLANHFEGKDAQAVYHELTST